MQAIANQHTTYNIQHTTYNIQHTTYNIQHNRFLKAFLDEKVKPLSVLNLIQDLDDGFLFLCHKAAKGPLTRRDHN